MLELDGGCVSLGEGCCHFGASTSVGEMGKTPFYVHIFVHCVDVMMILFCLCKKVVMRMSKKDNEKIYSFFIIYLFLIFLKNIGFCLFYTWHWAALWTKCCR